MYRLFPCIPTFGGAGWGGDGGVIKKCKKCVCMVGLKTVLLLVKNVFFSVKNCMSELRFYFCLRFRCHFFRHTKF